MMAGAALLAAEYSVLFLLLKIVAGVLAVLFEIGLVEKVVVVVEIGLVEKVVVWFEELGAGDAAS